jgi:hypothetical protein
MLEQLDRRQAETDSSAVARMLKVDSGLEEIAVKQRRLNGPAIDGELDRAEYAARKKDLVNAKIGLEAGKTEIARQGAEFWIEPVREVVNAVRERKLPIAGGDLGELRNFVARVGLNLSLNSRKVLWDWVPPFAPLARRDLYQNWWAAKDLNPRPSD